MHTLALARSRHSELVQTSRTMSTRGVLFDKVLKNGDTMLRVIASRAKKELTFKISSSYLGSKPSGVTLNTSDTEDFSDSAGLLLLDPTPSTMRFHREGYSVAFHVHRPMETFWIRQEWLGRRKNTLCEVAIPRDLLMSVVKLANTANNFIRLVALRDGDLKKEIGRRFCTLVTHIHVRREGDKLVKYYNESPYLQETFNGFESREQVKQLFDEACKNVERPALLSDFCLVLGKCNLPRPRFSLHYPNLPFLNEVEDMFVKRTVPPMDRRYADIIKCLLGEDL